MVRSSPIFGHFHSSILTIAQRSRGDPAYDEWLGLLSTNHAPGPVELQEGEVPPTARRVYLPPQCYQTASLDEALVWLFGPVPPPVGPYPPLNPRHPWPSTLHKTADQANDHVLDPYLDPTCQAFNAAPGRPQPPP